MTLNPVRDHVRQATAQPEAKQSSPMVMWALRHPVICGPVGCCAHVQCLDKIRQSRLPCYICETVILPGERFYPVTKHEGRVVTQCHATCEEWARR